MASHLSRDPISKGGAKIREQLLEAAGEVFADRGFQAATSREICIRAGVNLAAVNYHFGGFDALYVATLKEAHRRANSMAPLDEDVMKDTLPRDRLRAVVRNFVSRLVKLPADSWEMRLVSRELVIPTFAQAEFIAASIEPRRAFLRSIIGDIINRPPTDPLVARCLFSVIAPCIMLSVINRPSLNYFLPDAGSAVEGIEELIDHIERFVLAGLDAVVQDTAVFGSN